MVAAKRLVWLHVAVKEHQVRCTWLHEDVCLVDIPHYVGHLRQVLPDRCKLPGNLPETARIHKRWAKGSPTSATYLPLNLYLLRR